MCPKPTQPTPLHPTPLHPSVAQASPTQLTLSYPCRYCNGVLWPLFHSVVASAPEERSAMSEQAQWEAYKAVNAKFASAVEGIIRKEDMVC